MFIDIFYGKHHKKSFPSIILILKLKISNNQASDGEHKKSL